MTGCRCLHIRILGEPYAGSQVLLTLQCPTLLQMKQSPWRTKYSANAPSAKCSSMSSNTPRRRVLLLESDRLIRQLIVEWLQMAGYETVCISDPALAKQMAHVKLNILLVDVPAPYKAAR